MGHVLFLDTWLLIYIILLFLMSGGISSTEKEELIFRKELICKNNAA